MIKRKLIIIFTALLTAAALTAPALGSQNSPLATRDSLLKDISSYLQQQNYDSEISNKLAKAIIKDTLYWSPQRKDVKNADYIIGFSFGNRIDKAGNRHPGPMNEQIADLIVKLYKQNPLHVYAQWEIAQCIGDRIPKDKVTAIFPKISKTGDVIYLSTIDVAEEIIKDIGRGKVDSKTFIVAAFREHAPRCIMVCQKYGLKNSFIPHNFELPDKYDPESGQPWTRDKFKYMIYDMACRFEDLN